MSWLLFGAVLGGAPTYAIAAAITLIERLMRYRSSARGSAQHSRRGSAPYPRSSYECLTKPKKLCFKPTGRDRRATPSSPAAALSFPPSTLRG